MTITIHRGINQIGGCITEIATDSTKIFIDLGRNLPKGDKPANDPKANRKAIQELTEGVNAIFYTHYHGDHIDLYKYVPENIPQYIGEVAKQVMVCKSKVLAGCSGIKDVTEEDVAKLEKVETFIANEKVEIGDITVTPYFVSHSACDAYMFLIESNIGESVLHTGDFREHGYLGGGLEKILKAFIVGKEIDVLITEGTMLSRPQEKVKHENDLKMEAKELMTKYKNVFVMCSSTDIDRLATFHAANKEIKKQKPFVCDDYQLDILDIFSKTSGKETSLFNFKAYPFFEKNQKLIDWILDKGCCMLVRATEKFEKYWDLLKPQLNMQETVLIYSMWSEYINPNSRYAKQDYLNFVSKFPRIEKLHTSGHASAETLAKVCELVNPQEAIIPIHSEHSSDFSKLNISDKLKEKMITDSTFEIIKMRQLKTKSTLTEEEKKHREGHLEKFLESLRDEPEMTHEEHWERLKSEFKQRTGLKEGAHVRYKGISDKDRESPLYRMYWRGTHPNPNKILDLETIYEIEHIEIYGTGTVVKLVGFGDETFLGGLFEPIDRNESINN
ncbi:MAG: MBL fold metallo-hydrolase [Lentimicrobiaceae bacterium]|nr:MBL fold metallo-hydrolase [Lentimicrobiaceae bacterium]